jgi:FkbH-like protein
VLDAATIWTAFADPDSALADGDLDAVIVHVEGEDLLDRQGGPGPFLLEQVDQFCASRPGVHVVLNTLVADVRSAASFAAGALPESAIATRARWDLGVTDLAERHPGVVVVDLATELSELTRTDRRNRAYWYLGRIAYSTAALAQLARAYSGVLSAIGTAPRKVLVLDLDNTLWGGVLGEEGIGGIELSEDGTGKCYRDLQRRIAELAQTGVLLAIASKNDEPLAHQVLDEHPNMVLRTAQFVATRINWNNKADNIRSIAQQLDLGLDAFVLLDDNPVERALVNQELPEVLAPDFPDRPERLADWFIDEVVPTAFARTRVLESDRSKTQQYQARVARTEAESATADLTGFLEKLEVHLRFLVDDPSTTARVAQMTQKTNQFNLTTARLTTAEVQVWLDDEDRRVIACEYRDRFGDEGVIGVAFLDVGEGRLTNLLMSCRVLGRRVEQRLLEHVEVVAAAAGLTALTASYIPTDRNGVAAGFLPESGFHPDASSPGDTVRKDLR